MDDEQTPDEKSTNESNKNITVRIIWEPPNLTRMVEIFD
jgi:hypothetical protein